MRGVVDHALAVDPDFELRQAVGLHVLSVAMSAWRTTPRTVMIWRSELISMSLDASTSMSPPGSTPTTRAVRLVLITVVRLMLPSPFRVELPERLARLASGPVALVTPASAVMVLAAAGGALGLGGPGGHRRRVLHHDHGEDVVHLAGAHVARRIRQARTRRPDGARRGRRGGGRPRIRRGHELIHRRDHRRLLLGLAGRPSGAQDGERHRQNSFHRSPLPTDARPLPSTRAMKRFPETGLRTGMDCPVEPGPSATHSNSTRAPPTWAWTSTASPRAISRGGSSHCRRTATPRAHRDARNLPGYLFYRSRHVPRLGKELAGFEAQFAGCDRPAGNQRRGGHHPDFRDRRFHLGPHREPAAAGIAHPSGPKSVRRGSAQTGERELDFPLGNRLPAVLEDFDARLGKLAPHGLQHRGGIERRRLSFDADVLLRGRLHLQAQRQPAQFRNPKYAPHAGQRRRRQGGLRVHRRETRKAGLQIPRQHPVRAGAHRQASGQY